MLRIALLAAAGVGLIATASPAHAEFIKRSMLVKACAGKAVTDVSDCAGYIAGVADLASNPPPGTKAEVCFPAPVKVRTLREAVASYLESHPGADGPAAPPVFEALKTLYKCS